MIINKQVYIKRRNKLMNSIGDGIVIIPTTDEVIRNQDSVYQYRYDSNFYYLTGFEEPESVLVIDTYTKKSILFCREKDKDREMWDGFRYGVLNSREAFGFDETFSISEFPHKILELASKAANLYYTIGCMHKYDQIIIETLNKLRRTPKLGVIVPHCIIDINYLVAEMRLFKDKHDISLIRKTCEISSLAHIAAMKFIKTAKYEYEIEAKLLEVFYKNGARYPSYTPIVASGENSCILHYVANNKKIKKDELILIDAGCEYMGYAGDVTRTYPVNGKFNKEQQAIYEIVLEANKKAIEKVQVGSMWNEPGVVATRIITQGLVDLKILNGSVDDNIANNNYKQYYMHGIGHWLGLDVHDVGTYQINGSWREYEVGMCTTIEPGIYIRPNQNVAEKYWNIGIRIEDDILLTKKGAEVLTILAPKEIKDIEKIINN